MLDKLRQQQTELVVEKQQIQSQLVERSKELQQHQQEKEALLRQIESMERRLLVGGAPLRENPEFHAAVAEVERRLMADYHVKFQELEAERQRLADEKAHFERERNLFSRRMSDASG